MQHNCLVYFLEIVFPYGRGKASLDVYLKELSVHSRMSDLICHRRETHAHSLKKKSLQICRLSSHIPRAGVRFLAASLPFDLLFRHCKVDLTETHSALHLRLCAERSTSPSPNSFKYSSEESDRVLKAASLSQSDLSSVSLFSFMTFLQILLREEGGKYFDATYSKFKILP